MGPKLETPSSRNRGVPPHRRRASPAKPASVSRSKLHGSKSLQGKPLAVCTGDSGLGRIACAWSIINEQLLAIAAATRLSGRHPVRAIEPADCGPREVRDWSWATISLPRTPRRSFGWRVRVRVGAKVGQSLLAVRCRAR